MSHIEKQNHTEIAAFDFDGTLIKSDSMREFLIKSYGAWPLFKILVKSPALSIGMIAQSTRGAQKWELISPIIGRINDLELSQRANDFFNIHGQSLWRPEALKAWDEHKKNGRKCVIISGSLRPILEPFAAFLHADALLCTEVECTENGIIPIGENCVGQEKLRRLKAHFGDNLVIHSAYGDTKGDYEMLTAALNAYYRRF